MPYPATAIANEFIELSGGQSLSPMKLLKLVYFAHGWYLAFADKPLINEPIEAWQFGPVISNLYHEFKHYGANSVNQPAMGYSFVGGRGAFHEPRVSDGPDAEENANVLDLLRQIWEIYGKYSAVRLSNATHEPGTPWSDTYKEGLRYQFIPNELIQRHFKSLQGQK